MRVANYEVAHEPNAHSLNLKLRVGNSNKILIPEFHSWSGTEPFNMAENRTDSVMNDFSILSDRALEHDILVNFTSGK